MSLEAHDALPDLIRWTFTVDPSHCQAIETHLDDLGAENQTDWVLEQLYSIVNARYEAERPIVATTNLMPDELSERLGPRTVSRLVEICGDLIPLYGEDKRREFRAG